MKVCEWTKKHPKITKVIKITGVVMVFCGTFCVSYIAVKGGYKVEVTSLTDRENRVLDLGFAENLRNGALGTEARGFNASAIWAKRDAIVKSYIA